MTSERKVLVALVGVPFILLSMVAGCVAPDGSDPDGSEGEFFSVHIRTSYDRNARSNDDPRHKYVDLPQGHPASNLEIDMFYPESEEQTEEVWNYDPPCPYVDDTHGQVDCSEYEKHPKKAYVIPPPSEAVQDYRRTATYPLNDNGEITIRFPTTLMLSIGTAGPYTTKLMEEANEPDRCPHHPQAGSDSGREAWQHVEGGIVFLPSGIVRLQGDGSVTHLWYGACPKYEEV